MHQFSALTSKPVSNQIVMRKHKLCLDGILSAIAFEVYSFVIWMNGHVQFRGRICFFPDSSNFIDIVNTFHFHVLRCMCLL